MISKPSGIMKEVDKIIDGIPLSHEPKDVTISRAELSNVIGTLMGQRVAAQIIINLGADGNSSLEVRLKGNSAKRVFESKIKDKEL